MAAISIWLGSSGPSGAGGATRLCCLGAVRVHCREAGPLMVWGLAIGGRLRALEKCCIVGAVGDDRNTSIAADTAPVAKDRVSAVWRAPLGQGVGAAPCSEGSYEAMLCTKRL